MTDDVKSDMEADAGEHPGYKLALKVIEGWPVDGREFTRERWLADLINTQCAEIRRLDAAASVALAALELAYHRTQPYSEKTTSTIEAAFATLRAASVQSPAERGEEGKYTGVVDPRAPDYSRPGIFATHNCWKCRDGQQPCVCGDPCRCEYPHARDD